MYPSQCGKKSRKPSRDPGGPRALLTFETQREGRKEGRKEGMEERKEGMEGRKEGREEAEDTHRYIYTGFGCEHILSHLWAEGRRWLGSCSQGRSSAEGPRRGWDLQQAGSRNGPDERGGGGSTRRRMMRRKTCSR